MGYSDGTPIQLTGQGGQDAQNQWDQSQAYQKKYGVMPDDPVFKSLAQGDGTMQKNLQVDPGAPITGDTRGIEAFRQLALRDPSKQSAWAQMMTAKQGASEGNAMNNAAQQQASGTASGMGSLAMQGGLDSGARERIALNGQRGLLNAQQDVARQGSDQRMNIGIQDEANRTQALSQLPGMEINQLDPQFRNQANQMNAQQFNASNAINQNQAQNLFNYGMFDSKMKAFGANQTANATAANSGGSWLCTEANSESPLSNEDIQALSKLRRYSWRISRELTRDYLFGCAPLIGKMKDGGADWEENTRFVRTLINEVNAGNIPLAFDFYVNHTMSLIEKFWPECELESFKQRASLKIAHVSNF